MDTKLRVLQVCHRFYPEVGGIQTHVQALSEWLYNHGVDVVVFTTDHTGKLDKYSKIASIPVYRFRSFAPKNYYYFSPQMLPSLARAKRFDIIHAHGYQAFPLLAATLTKRINKVPLVVSTHLGYPRDAALHLAYRKVGDVIFKLADAIITYSKQEELALRNEGLNLGSKVMNIPDGIDDRFFQVRRESADGKILYVGRLEKCKGVHILIKALSLLKNENFELEIIGEGSFRKELEKLALSLGLSNKVQFYGVVEKRDLFSFYAHANVFILPSADTYLGLGLAVLQAMASALPVIISPVQSNVLIDGKTGIIVKEFTKPKAVAESIKKLLYDKNLAQYIGNNAREAVREYSCERVYSQFLKLYERVRVCHSQ